MQVSDFKPGEIVRINDQQPYQPEFVGLTGTVQEQENIHATYVSVKVDLSEDNEYFERVLSGRDDGLWFFKPEEIEEVGA